MNLKPTLRPFLLILVFLLVLSMIVGHTSPTAAAGGVGPATITEFMADNDTILADEDGAFSDWIELHNPTGTAVTLTGWYLTDSATNLTKWQFPVRTLNAGDYLVVFASNKNRTGAELHTNFALSLGGEYLALVQPDGLTIAWEYSPTFPPQQTDISYGADSNGRERFYSVPTPGAANDGPLANQSPLFLATNLSPTEPTTADDLLFTATVVASPTAVDSVTLHYTLAGSGITTTLPLLDDGLSGDGTAGDTVYGGTLPSGTFPSGGLVLYWFTAVNTATATTRHPFNPATTPFAIINGSQTVFINEIMASNTFSHLGRGAYTADVNDFEDWLELYNPSGAPIDLSGYYLTNDLANPTLWLIPAGTTIPANGHRLFWGMGADAATPNSTNFKISASGGQLALYDPAQNLVDAVLFGTQTTDVTYGRATDGSPAWGYFGQSTAAASNNTAVSLPTLANTAPPTQFSLTAGFYPIAQTLTLSSTLAGAEIWFTTNGAIPTQGGAGSTLYAAPLAINSTAVVRARTFATGYLPSRAQTRTYFINFANPAGLPIVSYNLEPTHWAGDNMISLSITGSNGIPKSNCQGYTPHNYFQSWERPIALEIFDPAGNPAVNMEMGIRMFGNCSRSITPKSTALRPRDSYGDDTLSYPFFSNRDTVDFPALLLRNSGQDYNRSLMRDGFAQSLLVGHMENVDYQSYAPSIVFRNGVYEGILNFREKMDERYIELYHGYQTDEIDFIERVRYGPAVPVLEAAFGSLDGLNGLMDYVKNNDMTNPTVYISATQQLDLPAYMNYYIAQVYYANSDWPSNNLRIWRPLPAGQWRWMLYDTESGFRNSAVNANSITRAISNNGSAPEWSYIIFQRMMVNETFRNEYAQRSAAHLSITFDPVRVVDLLDAAADRIAPEVPRHVAKWGFPTNWAGEIQDMRNFANGRPNNVYTHIAGYNGADQISTTSNLNIVTTPPGGGRIFAHEVPVPTANFTGRFYNTIPLRLQATAEPGYTFIGWQRPGFPDDPTATLTITLSANDVITAVFEPTAPVILTEIHYNPSVGQGPDQEFIELYNTDSLNPFDLQGFGFSAGIGHTFTLSTVIPPNGYLLLAHPNATYNTATLGCEVVKWTSGRLDNAGETLTLQNSLAELVNSVSYADQSPWPTEPDGLGYSLGLYDVALPNSQPANWYASSLPNGGTPCQPNQSQIRPQADLVGPVALASVGNVFSNLLANDQGAFVGDGLTITAVGTPTLGTITAFTSYSVTYAAPAVGTSDSFTYTVQSNATGQTATAVVTVQISPATPGGISSNLVFWLRADVGTSTTADSSPVTGWADQSGNNHNATSLTTAPTFAASALNFNPLLTFAGGTQGMTIANSASINTSNFLAKSTCVAFRTGADVATRQIVYEQGGQTNGLNFYILGGELYANLWVSNANNHGNTPIAANTAYIACSVYEGNSFFRAYLNGVQFLNDTAVPANLTGHSGAIGIGQVQQDTRYHDLAFGGNGDPFTGQIGELIQHNQTLSDGDRWRIESYLAIKYGLTLPEGVYRDTADTLLHNIASHNQQIAGIGLDGLTGLDQPQSRGGMVTVNGSPEAQQFLLWGHDGGTGLNTADLPPNYAERLNRTWVALPTGLNMADTLTFDLTGWGVSGSTPADFLLLIDSDTTFADAPRLIPPDSVAGDLISFAEVAFNSGDYFTLVTAIQADSDGDGVGDQLECPSGNPNTPASCDDADGDGTPDFLDELTICGLGSLPTGEAWLFDTPHPLYLSVQARGTLECVRVTETAGLHPQGQANGSAVNNNWWYDITGYDMARTADTPNGTFSATLTMPTSFATTFDSGLCRYTGGPGRLWQCGGGPIDTNFVEQSGVSAFSAWSAGEELGATAVSFTQTVGTDPATCGTAEAITLPYTGGEVTYCYTIANTGAVTLTEHTLATQFGLLLDDEPYLLAPNASLAITHTVLITATTANTATWTAENLPLAVSLTATDTTTVAISTDIPGLALSQTVGTDPTTCAASNSLHLPPLGGTAVFCYRATNTGNITLTHHTVVDSQLGTIWNSFATDLPPSSSFFITETVLITQPVAHSATWTAVNGSLAVTDTATATVTVEPLVLGVQLSADEAQSGTVGEVVTYTVAISNTGNAQNSFALEVLTSEWATALSETTILLGAGDSTTFAVGVTVPLTAADGQMDTAVIRASSGGVSETVSLTTTAVVNVVDGVELSADEAQSGPVGEVVTYTVAISNTGNAQNSFALEVLTSEWATALSETTILLGAGDSTTFAVGVTVPLTAANGQMDTAVIRASSGGVSETVSLTTTAVVNVVYGVELSADEAQSGPVGEVVTYTVAITNTGNAQNSFALAQTGGAWAAALSETAILLDAEARTTFEVVVTVPLTAADGQFDTAVIWATGNDGVTATVSLTTTAVVVEPPPPTYGVELSAATQAQSGDAGTAVTYTLHLTNTGDVTDTFALSVAGEWTADLSAPSITLAGGSSAQFTVVVSIPANVLDGQSDVAMVTAISQTDGTATAAVQLTTTAVVEPPPPPPNPVIYLPLIFR